MANENGLVRGFHQLGLAVDDGSELRQYSDAANAILRDGHKLIVAMIGLSGSGKSRVVDYLCSHVTAAGGCKVLSLDVYRELANQGRYPVGEKEHRAVNAIAVPRYLYDLNAAREQLIVVDNTNLRWENGLQAVVDKASRDRYHLLCLTAPLSRYSFVESRSLHGVHNDIFINMAQAWPGARFAPFFYRILPPEALMPVQDGGLVPTMRDRFSKLTYSHAWGERGGLLYVMDGYLGYVDADMFDKAALPAIPLMQREGDLDLFLRKDGILHVTLITPQKKANPQLKAVAQALLTSPPPQLAYSGVSCAVTNDTRVYYAILQSEAQQEWTERVDAACSMARSSLHANPDGLHVTLGYTRTDVHGINKRGPPPLAYDLPCETTSYMPPFRGIAKGASSRKDSADVSNAEIAQFLTRKMPSFAGESLTIEIPREHASNIARLLRHTNVKCKFREIPTEALQRQRQHLQQHAAEALETRYMLIGFQVVARRGLTIDETIYKRDKWLQEVVPRGLTYMLECSGTGHVSLTGIVYPTSKFFGDNDLQDDVVVETDEALESETAHSSQLVATEKVNGEMFTFSCLAKRDDGQGNGIYVCVTGSKNNKFAFEVQLRGARSNQADIDHVLASYLRQQGDSGKAAALTSKQGLDLEAELEWTQSNVWLEMSRYFLLHLLKLPVADAEQFLERLWSSRETACGEFESYLHAHLVMFPYGYQSVRFFALTSYGDSGEPRPTTDIERLEQISWLDKLGLGTVRVTRMDSAQDVLAIRRDVWHRRGVEGVVLLVIRDGRVETMIKMKTIWYVVHRGFRERLRRFIAPQNAAKQLLNPQQVVAELRRVLDAKLRIFNMQACKDERTAWLGYIDRLVGYIVDKRKTCGHEALASEYRFRYPHMIAGAEEWQSTEGPTQSAECENKTKQDGDEASKTERLKPRK